MLLKLKRNSKESSRKEKKVIFLASQAMKVKSNFLVPTDVQGNCTVNAVDCFSNILDELQMRMKKVVNVSNTISNTLRNLEEIMGMNSQERKEKKLCYNKECIFSLQRRNMVQALEDFSTLLNQMYQVQQ
ncbi:uncharacterized protein ACNLHF_017529 [Anomaloglossus baeobatrachus]